MATSEWETALLADVLQRPERAEAKPPGGEIPLVGVRLFGQGAYEASRKDAANVKAATLYRVRAGDFIYNRMWATRGTFAVVAEALDGYYATNEFPIFSADEQRLLLPYLALVAQSSQFLSEVDAAAVGSTDRRRLHPERFLELEIDLPPIDEQRAILDAVTAADDAVAAASEERHLAFAVLHAAIEALVVPARTWDELPEGWELKELGDVADVRSGITKGRKTHEPLQPVPFLRAANVQDGYLDLVEIKTIDVTAAEKVRFQLQRGDVLMVEGGNAEHLGRGWIWNDEIEGCLHQNHVFRARPNPEMVEPRFLAYVIAASPARAYCLDKAKKTTNLASINKTQISALPVPLPPRDQQNEIVSKLDTIRAAAVETHEAHRRLRGLRAILVDSLLSGGWRVRKPLDSFVELVTG
jgi:type I restriction enzyme S subunit